MAIRLEHVRNPSSDVLAAESEFVEPFTERPAMWHAELAGYPDYRILGAVMISGARWDMLSPQIA